MGGPARFARQHRLIGIATMATLVAGLLAPQLADARRRSSVEIISTRTVATLSEGVIHICADETYTIEVTVEEEVVYRWSNDPPGTTHTSHRPVSRPVTVTAGTAPGAGASTTAATISPSSARVRPPSNSASFTITGKDPGVAVLSIDATGATVGYGGNVIVDECAYEISLDSHWYFGVGFEPDVFSSLQGLVLRRVRPNVYIGTGSMHNSAAGVVKGCTPSFRLADSTVIVKGDIVPGQYRPEIKLNVSYYPVPVAVTVVCPRVPGKGNSTDTATIANVDVNMKAWEWMETTHYPGHVGASHLATATSNTFIVLKLIRP